MDYEITGLCAVNRRLRFRLPSCVGTGVIGENADDVQRGWINETYLIEGFEFAAKDEMKELFGRLYGFSHEKNSFQVQESGASIEMPAQSA